MKPTIILLCGFVFVFLSQEVRAARQPEIAVYVWDNSRIPMQESEEVRRKVLKWFGEKNVKTVYLNTPLDSSDDGNFLALLKDLKRAGIEIYALVGLDPDLVYPEKHQIALDRIDQVLIKARSYPNMFKGIIVNLEPHSQVLGIGSIIGENVPFLGKLTEITGEHATAYTGFLDLMVKIHERTDRLKNRRSNFEFIMVTSYWYDWLEITWRGKKGRLSDFVQAIPDGIAIMAYRDIVWTPSRDHGIAWVSKTELDYSDLNWKGKKPVWVGIETAEQAGAPQSSFFGKSPEYMHQQLGLIDAEFRKCPSYRGIAVQSLRDWAELEEKDFFNKSLAIRPR